jgi:drug/metabolite transporter (DMT)-like permease
VAIIAVNTSEHIRLSAGALYVLLAALAQSLFFVSQKPYLARYSAPQCASYSVWTGTFALLIFSPGMVKDLQTASLSATIAAVYLGIFPAALGYASWAYTLARIPAARAASFLYLVPAVTLGIAWTWLGEWPSWLALLGGAIAISGVVIVNLFGKIQSSVGANPRICSDRIFHILYLCWSSHRANFVYGENKLSSGSLRNSQSAANVRTRI